MSLTSGKSFMLCMRTSSFVHANNAKIVCRRDEQCNTEESFRNEGDLTPVPGFNSHSDHGFLTSPTETLCHVTLVITDHVKFEIFLFSCIII